MTKSTTALPQGYIQYDHINLQQDKKTAFIVNVAAAVLLLALLALGHFAFVPVSACFDIDSSGMGLYLGRMGVLLLGYVAYIILHELTHAAAMKLYHAQQVRFGFTGLYAYAGSEADYFGKRAYRVIALAPLVVWTVLLTVPLFFLQGGWFWVVYFIQCGNLSGCAGDVYVTLRLWNAPADILVRDTGTEMFVYSRQGKADYVNKNTIR